MEAVFARSGLDWLAVCPTTLVAGPPTGSVQVVDRSACAAGYQVATWRHGCLTPLRRQNHSRSGRRLSANR